MLEYLAAPILALLAVGAAAYYLYARRRKRAERISGLLSGTNLLASWAYSPEQWRAAAEEEFTWAGTKGGAARVYISPDEIYIKGDAGERLIDLSGGGRVVTHASFGGGEMSPLKLRVRRKVVLHHHDRPDEVKYYKDDYRIPVPAGNQEEAKRVVDFFTSRKEENLAAYADSVPEDEPLSLFGNDPF